MTAAIRTIPYTSNKLIIPVNVTAPWYKVVLTLKPETWEFCRKCNDESIDGIFIDVDTAGMEMNGAELGPNSMWVEFEIELETCDGRDNWKFSENPLVKSGNDEPVNLSAVGIHSLTLSESKTKLSFHSNGVTATSFGVDGFRFACEEEVKVWNESQQGWIPHYEPRYSPDPRLVFGRRV